MGPAGARYGLLGYESFLRIILGVTIVFFICYEILQDCILEAF